MYRAGIRPWQSAKWRPSDKPVHEHDVKEIREEVQEKGEVIGS